MATRPFFSLFSLTLNQLPMLKLLSQSPTRNKRVVWIKGFNSPDEKGEFFEKAKKQRYTWIATPYCRDLRNMLCRKRCEIKTVVIDLDQEWKDIRYGNLIRFLTQMKQGVVNLNGKQYVVNPYNIVVVCERLPYELDPTICPRCCLNKFRFVYP